MKKVFLFALAAGAVLSSSAQSFVINGKAESKLEGKTIYLMKARVAADSTVITNGQYTFKGTADKLVRASLAVGKGRQAVDQGYVFLEQGTISVAEGIAKGTPTNDVWATYAVQAKPLEDKLEGLNEEYRNAPNKQDTALLKSLRSRDAVYNAELTKINKAHILANLDNVTPAYLMNDCKKEFSIAEWDNIIAKASPALKENANFQNFVKLLDGMKRASVGAKFTDLKMKDVNDKDIALSDYVGKGKYVFVDFWASWCGPCRREIPNVKAAYEKFKDKGFEIVGVSFDSTKDAWTKAINDMGLTWPQMSDLKGWKCAASEVYAVHGIPFTLLIDPNGVIVEQNLRGEKIEAALNKYLK